MANGFENPRAFGNAALRSLMNNIVLGKHISRSRQGEFGKAEMKIGDTFNVRRPWRGTVSTGAAYNPQDYFETSVPLVVNTQSHIDTTFTSAELLLKVQDFEQRVIKPKLIQLAQQIDINCLLNAKNTVGNLTGTFGTAPNTLTFVTDLGKKLDDFSTPRDYERFYVVDQASNASLIGGLSGLFNNQKMVGEQYEQGVFMDATNTIGFKIAMSQNVARHTVGPLGGTPLVNGASQSLTSGWSNIGTLITDGWTAAAAQRTAAGDIFTIAGVNSVNPVNRQSTGQLLQFCCTAAQSSDASGNLTLSFSPAIITAGPMQNATAAPADNAALTINGTAATSYARNLAWHPDAFELAVVKMVDLAMFGGWGAVRERDGFAIRVFRQAAISTDTVGCRVDTLSGLATVYPEQAAQQVGA